ncbi:MAG: EcsC family protein [Muribaculaceae bacterium]|nr:EcsC family protein [Muribaculaceae bacterium]
MDERTTYEAEQIAAIKKWKQAEPSVLAKAGGTLLKPIEWVTARLIPNKVLEGALSAANAAGSMLADEGDVLRDGDVKKIEYLKSKDLALSDKLADSVHNWALGIAATEGGAAGATGVVGMLVDVPALITLAYRTIHKIGLCYGYVCTSPEERMFVNFIMSAANANSVKEKTISLVGLQQMSVLISKTTFKKMAEKAANDKFGKEAVVLFIKSFSKSLGKNLTKRKMLQAIPIAGGIIGASVNASFIQDVAWAARRSFQERWLKDNGKIWEEI